MKKIFAILMCALLICAVPISAFAEGEETYSAEADGVAEDNSAIETETSAEGENTITDTVMEGLEEEEKEEIKSITDQIVSCIEAHLDSISLFLTMILSIFYQIRKHKSLNKSIGTLNNNAISVAENSSSAISKALSNMEGVSGVVTGYQTEIAALLEAYRNTAEDRARLESELIEIHKALKLAKEANIEFSNELADLIALANIPNYKKEEMGARHLAAVHAIVEAETETEEVKEDVGEEK